MDKISDYLSTGDLLCQLAEECSELAQAALKLKRAMEGTNPTPKSELECWGSLEEEKPADVEPVRHWITCSERMPEVDDIYLCVYHFPSSNKSRCTTLFFYATDLTPHFQDENYCGIQVTRWFPTPPLPSLGER